MFHLRNRSAFPLFALNNLYFPLMTPSCKNAVIKPYGMSYEQSNSTKHDSRDEWKRE